jgi:basic membrane protein A and related proteins
MINKLKIVVLFFLLALPTLGFAKNIVVGFLVPISGLGDQSFNDMTYAGLIRAKNEMDFTLIRAKSDGPNFKSHQAAMSKLIKEGAEIIVTNGFEFREIVEVSSKKYPELQFIIHDIPMKGYPNVISTVFAQHEGSFLAGALAAWHSKTGRIGFIGGKDMPVIRAFQIGFKEGALYANKDIKIINKFLSKKEETSAGFDNPGLGYKKALEMFRLDVDIVFSVAGLSGNGIIRAAAEKKKFTIGVDANQDHMAKGYVLTSVIKRLDRATVAALRMILQEDISTGVFSFGLRENGVSLSPMKYTKDIISSEVLQKLEDIKKRIVDGEIVVTDYLTKISEQ